MSVSIISTIIIISIVICICVISICVISYNYFKSNQLKKDAYNKTTYNGKYFEGLNDIIQFDDNSTFYSYELLDFEQTVKNEDEELINFLPYEDAYAIRYLTVKDQKNILQLDYESQFIVNSMAQRPLTEEQLIDFSNAIIASRQSYQMLQRETQQKLLHEIYKKANYNETTMEKRNTGFKSMNEYYNNLSKDEQKEINQILKNKNLLIKLKG